MAQIDNKAAQIYIIHPLFLPYICNVIIKQTTLQYCEMFEGLK